MKKFVVVYIIIIATNLFGQNSQDSCFGFMQFEQNKNFCDTTILENGAKIYYTWNCDSTWLTFENDRKIILKSCADLDPIMCSRVSLNFIKEYPNYLLFTHKWASSGIWAPDVVFIDKLTGTEKNRIDKGLFIWGDAEENYILYFNDNSFNELIYLDHLLDKTYSYSFKENEVQRSIDKNHALQINELFKDFNRTYNFLDFSFINESNEKVKIKFELEK